jgi:hypothetical protein
MCFILKVFFTLVVNFITEITKTEVSTFWHSRIGGASLKRLPPEGPNFRDEPSKDVNGAICDLLLIHNNVTAGRQKVP